MVLLKTTRSGGERPAGAELAGDLEEMHHLELAVGAQLGTDTDEHQIEPVEPRLEAGPALQPADP
jgi:hypothetical protein